jgi:hypothetical protein
LMVLLVAVEGFPGMSLWLVFGLAVGAIVL